MRFMEFPFVPINEDGRFFEDDVRTMLREGRMLRVPVLVGTNKDEGSYWLPYYQTETFPFDHKKNAEDISNQARITWPQYLKAANLTFNNRLDIVAIKAVALQYIELYGPNPSPENLRDAASKILGDYFFTCDTISFATQMSEHVPAVYSYYFTQR